jgi:hypothetical protein
MASVAGGLPVAVMEANAEAEGVDLPLALGHAGLLVGEVVDGPGERLGVGGIRQEGVGVGIEEDATALTVDKAGVKALEVRVLLSKLEVRPNLAGGVAEPHSVDVAGDDEGVGLAVYGAGIDGGIEGVGVAVLEHARELGVGDLSLDAGDKRFDGGRRELARGDRRAACGGLGCERERRRKSGEGRRNCGL